MLSAFALLMSDSFCFSSSDRRIYLSMASAKASVSFGGTR